MGLIKAAVGAVGGVLADQWKEFFYCDSLNENILMAKGRKQTSRHGRSGNTDGEDNIISNGSRIAVNNGQCMLIVESGKVVEATVLFSEKYGTLMAILHDRTEREAEHQANLKRRKEATSLANEVIEKNMAAVQQIAQLLGESAAETKIALTRLEASLSPKEDHGK